MRANMKWVGLFFFALAALAPAARAGEVEPRHGLSVFGDLKYGPEFTHFDYVRPDAPKGGTIRITGLDTF